MTLDTGVLGVFPNRMPRAVAQGIYNWQAAVHVVRVPFFVAGAASAEEAVESLECGLYSVVCGLRSAGSVGSRVWSAECSAKCGVWSA